MIGLVFTLIIMTGSIYLIIEGNKKDDSAEFYGGLIATILSIVLMCLVIQNINTKDMRKVYKFKRLNEMKLDDYGFGLFEYNGAIYFKEADEGRCFDVRSGNEVIIGKDKIVTVLED
mgnify:FL=1|jgi:hypothetical protein